MGIIGFHNLNLAIRADRKNICIGNYDSREISPSDVLFHVAPYGRDYKNSHDMCDAAIADGYPIFDSTARVSTWRFRLSMGNNKDIGNDKR